MQYMDKRAINYLTTKWAEEKNLMRLVFRIIHLRSKVTNEEQHNITVPASREYVDRWVKKVSNIAPSILVLETWMGEDKEEVEKRNKEAVAKLRSYAKAMGFTMHKTKVGYEVDPVNDCLKKLIKIGWTNENKKEVTLSYHSHKHTIEVCEYVSNK